MKRWPRSAAVRLPWLLLAGVLVAWPALAQTQPAPPPPAGPTPPERIVPRAQPEKPSGGVIVPPHHVDRGMVKHPPPGSHFPTPVLPPPASGSGKAPPQSR